MCPYVNAMMADSRELRMSEGKVEWRDWQLREIYEKIKSGFWGPSLNIEPNYTLWIESLKINPRNPPPIPITIDLEPKRLDSHLHL